MHQFSVLIFIFVLLLGGCATLEPPPLTLSDFEQELFTDRPGKVLVVVYRSVSTKKWYWGLSQPDIYVDRKPFVTLHEKEYVQIYLTAGKHEIMVESHPAGVRKLRRAKILVLQEKHPVYLDIAQRYDGASVCWGLYYFIPIPFPCPGEEFYMLLKTKADAQKSMETVVDKELFKARRVKSQD